MQPELMNLGLCGHDSFEKFLCSFKRLGVGAIDRSKMSIPDYNAWVLADESLERANQQLSLGNGEFDRFLRTEHQIDNGLISWLPAIRKVRNNTTIIIARGTLHGDSSKWEATITDNKTNVIDFCWAFYILSIGANRTRLHNYKIWIHGIPTL